MPRVLHIDVETYSSEDIKTAGAYRYCESIDFELLMAAYAFDDGPVKIWDIEQSRELPKELLEALKDPKIEKHAHNANFERNVFKAIGISIPVGQWHCSQVKAAYCGLPLGLEQLTSALDLRDKGKLSTGKALIRFFAMPCKPTKANDKRTRNLPKHDPERWEEFKLYCMGDVEAEREVSRLLEGYTMPETERKMYNLDQHINDRGIRIDTDMAATVYDLYKKHNKTLLKQIKDITGLDNPNSAAQLKEWLSEILGQNINTLDKKAMPGLLELAGDGPAGQVLKLRSRSSKTSIKKYPAMLACVCADQRARGLVQFYGANRTGRWAGRLVQLQNLPQNHMDDLETARRVFASGDYDLALMMYDEILSVISELIRTAFIAAEGHTFAVADFSAIEARVIAWLANEAWRLKVFNTHGKIYEASASMMFNVPIEEVTKGSDYRAKGKAAELALGYQGAVGALKQMGGEAMGLSEAEMKGIVKRWRAKNPAVVQLWADLEAAAMHVTKNKNSLTLHKYRCLRLSHNGEAMAIELPSGRSLYYREAQVFIKTSKSKYGPWTREALRYKGIKQETKQWGWVDTYGGKLTENVIQAIARDLLTDSMLRIDAQGYPIVMHVHDEAVAEVPMSEAEESLREIEAIMSEPIEWAEGLPLAADGYITPFYKKD